MNRGSEWNKWDLHFHTPSSYDYKDKTVTNAQLIEKLVEKNIKVVAITDHHIIDVVRIQELKVLSSERITILPGIEFLSDSRGKQPIHFIGIFSENSDLHYIWGQIENRTEIRKIKGEGKKENEVYCNLFETINLIHELGGIVSIHAGDKHSSIENITHSLPHGEAQKTDIAYAVDIYELGNASDQDGYRKVVFPYIKKTIPMILCSDNHDIKNYDIKENCWIKANPTFDGLKQIVYEPSRVHIGENKPQCALHKLEEIRLSFEENIKWKNSQFCFVNFNEHLKFSPYLTCIIGGRGSGKSTLLNLIAVKIGKNQEKFISELSEKNIKTKISSKPEIIDNIEYLAQNEIEDFAKDSKEFTKAIFERLDKKSNGRLVVIQNNISTCLKTFDEQIDRLLLKNKKEIELQSKSSAEARYRHLLSAFSSGEFTTKRISIDMLSKEKRTRFKWKENYDSTASKLSELINSINTLLGEVDESPETWTNDNYYKKAHEELSKDLNESLGKYKNIDFSANIARLDDIEKGITNLNQEIELYLRNQGFNIENISDLKDALANIETINKEKENISNELSALDEQISGFNFAEIDSHIESFKEAIDADISSVNTLFDDISKNNIQDVKTIKIEYLLDDKVFDNIFDEFIGKLSLTNEISSFKSTFREYLNQISVSDTLSSPDIESFKTKIAPRTTQAYNKLIDVFSLEVNLNIYKLLIEKHHRDIAQYKILKVYYDEKAMENASFGQRCTAAIVVLLSLGNTPIIIDEPEAHLDSSLIANYLVELIKMQKQQRQIIFATHNANFVLNGDAELIIKLENTNGLTKSVSFAIEDLNHREDLLKLEGGKEAFKKREQKYNI